MYTVSCAERKITGESTTWMPYIILITACHGRVHEIKAKRHRRNLKSDWRTKRTGKKRVWNRVFGCWSGQIGTNRLFWVVGRDVGFSVSKSGTVPTRSGRLASMGGRPDELTWRNVHVHFSKWDEQKLPFYRKCHFAVDMKGLFCACWGRQPLLQTERQGCWQGPLLITKIGFWGHLQWDRQNSTAKMFCL